MKTVATSDRSATFTLSQVLSITTGRLCCGIGDVYSILHHVTGDNIFIGVMLEEHPLFTYVLPLACRFAGPLILEEHPELAKAGTDEALHQLGQSLFNSTVKLSQATRDWVVMDWVARLGLKSEYTIRSHADAWLSMVA